MLDTNTVSHLIRGHLEVTKWVRSTPMASLCISAVTEGEIHVGLARRPDAKRLHAAVHEFLLRVDTLVWDRPAALRYGELRAHLEHRGQSLGAFDLMIAAHALSIRAVLVTNDAAFGRVDGLTVEDWTGPQSGGAI